MYEDGSVYSLYTNKILKPTDTLGYYQYTLYINGEVQRYKAHKLVALLFLDPPDSPDKNIINHIDGNKHNNHFSNLEWCTYYHNNKHARDMGLNNVSLSNSNRWKNDEFRKRTSANISKGILLKESTKGKNNGRFRYEITDSDGNEISRTELSKILNLSQSHTDLLIRKCANGENIDYFNQLGININDNKEKVNRLSKA